ncbi:MAG: hypothetical protein ACM3RX_01995 [Methanococcaceae archaeon]
MELIPILSFIILVATISTFILAVGAYILYKIRENKGRGSTVQNAPQPRMVEAELYTAPPMMVQPDIAMQRQPGAGYQDPYYQKVSGERAVYGQPQPERGYQEPTQRYTQAGQAPGTRQYQAPGNNEQTGNSTDKKFMKYTSEGYVPVSKTKNTGENLKWR